LFHYSIINTSVRVDGQSHNTGLTVYGFKIARSAHPHKHFQARPARDVIDAGRVKRAVDGRKQSAPPFTGGGDSPQDTQRTPFFSSNLVDYGLDVSL